MIKEITPLIGQVHIKEYINKAMEFERIPKALIISGEKGSGKLEIAKAFALSALNSDKEEHPDINYIDLYKAEPSKKGLGYIDLVREGIVNRVDLAPVTGKYKFFIVLGANLLTIPAQNALLKSLEEALDYVCIILLTDNASKLLPTIRSRASILFMEPIETEKIVKNLEAKGIDPGRARIGAELSGGNLMKALSLCEETEYLDFAENVISTVTSVAGGRAPAAFKEEIKLINNSFEKFLQLMEIIIRDVLVYKETSDMSQVMITGWKIYIERLSEYLSYETIGKIRESIYSSRLSLLANGSSELLCDLMLALVGGNIEKTGRSAF